MRDYVMRLHRCGIPIRTAVKVYADFKKRHKLDALMEYIECVEAMSDG